MPVFALSIHADYRCRHSGACCTADWDVPVELTVYRSLDEALAAGRLSASAAARREMEGSLAPFITGPDLPEGAGAILERTSSGDCVFFEPSSRLCIVHRDLGEPALPATCRHFPRVALRDSRGTFITLSHYCPTAASMLFRDDVAVEIVADPPAFPPSDYEGLNVHPDAWPPLLHPRMLMDLEGYTAWEAHMVRRCSETSRAPEAIIATLARDAAMLRQWKPGGITLPQAVAALPRQPETVAAPSGLDVSRRHHADVLAAVPDDLRPAPDERGLDEAFRGHVLPAWDDFRAPLARYLAAKAFAAWCAYQGRGLATVVRSLAAALELVRLESARRCRDAGRRLDADLLREAIRDADFLLNHLATGDALAGRWSRAELAPAPALQHDR